jgi:hypothetical protein
VTKWASSEDRFDYSCFLGSVEQFEHFKVLAQQARFAFAQLINELQGKPRHASYDAYVAWVADLYFCANTGPAPLLAVEHVRVGEWLTATGKTRLELLSADDSGKLSLRALKTAGGDPVAIHLHQALTQDVFTASAAMLASLFAEAEAESSVALLSLRLDRP